MEVPGVTQNGKLQQNNSIFFDISRFKEIYSISVYQAEPWKTITTEGDSPKREPL